MRTAVQLTMVVLLAWVATTDAGPRAASSRALTGPNMVTFAGTGAPGAPVEDVEPTGSGVYVYRLVGPDFAEARKMVLLK